MEIFHRHVDTSSERPIPQSFTLEDSPVRCVVSTIAFGLGFRSLMSDIFYTGDRHLPLWVTFGRWAGVPMTGNREKRSYTIHPPAHEKLSVCDIQV